MDLLCTEEAQNVKKKNQTSIGSVSNKSKTETTAFAKLDKALRSPRWQKHSSALIYRSTKATADLAENQRGPKLSKCDIKANELYPKRVAILNVPVQCEAQAQVKGSGVACQCKK